MALFFRKLFKTHEGKKFLVFAIIVLGFVSSVALGENQMSWFGFTRYLKSNSQNSRVQNSVLDQYDAQNQQQGTIDTKTDFVRVKRVVDGDTIELETGEKVRYIGMNTPESVKINFPVECFGKIASEKNKEMVEGKFVRLEKDISDKDRYGRLLRFIYLEDGTFVNDVLVREGYARVSTFPPDVKFSEQFKAAEREAKSAKRGLWADDTCAGKK
jgi:endonuclease YncB( thermonuclease family)